MLPRNAAAMGPHLASKKGKTFQEANNELVSVSAYGPVRRAILPSQ